MGLAEDSLSQHQLPPEPVSCPRADSSSSSQDEVSILPKHTRVLITGNNRTKRSLVGQEAVVKKAVGLGGWHWLVLGNGEEVRLQRNALSVLEIGPDEQQDSGSGEDKDARDVAQNEILTHPRIRRPSRVVSLTPDITKKTSASCRFTDAGAPLVNLHRLDAQSLRRYRQAYQLDDLQGQGSADVSVYTHFQSLHVDEAHVLLAFVAALRKRRATMMPC